MKYPDFVKKTQAQAQLDSAALAEQFIQGTFEVLANRIAGNEAKDIAAQLPEEIGQYLRGHENENGTYMDLDEFCSAIAERTNVGTDVVSDKLRRLFAVMQEAVTPGLFDDLRTNLPDAYAPLLP